MTTDTLTDGLTNENAPTYRKRHEHPGLGLREKVLSVSCQFRVHWHGSCCPAPSPLSEQIFHFARRQAHQENAIALSAPFPHLNTKLRQFKMRTTLTPSDINWT